MLLILDWQLFFSQRHEDTLMQFPFSLGESLAGSSYATSDYQFFPLDALKIFSLTLILIIFTVV